MNTTKENRLKDLKNQVLESSILHGFGLKDTSFIVDAKQMNTSIIAKVINECHNEDFYHKFVISNVGENARRHFVLKPILEFLDPAVLNPVFFRRQPDKCIFLASNCREAIMKLIANKLKIKNPTNENSPFQILIICNFIGAVNVGPRTNNIQQILKERFNPTTRSFNLNDFCDDEELEDYCPLYIPKVMQKVAYLVSEFSPVSVNFQNNHLRDINSVYPLDKICLEYIDLGNNEISTIADLACLKYYVNLKSINLEGNPICKLYDSYNYILHMRELCKSLEILDEYELEQPPTYKKNFVCNMEAKYFASDFMEHFFTVYDMDDRENIADLYDKNAVFSVSSRIIPYEKNSETTNLEHFGLGNPYAVQGIDDILEVFAEFPKSCHDPYTFVCDVLIYEPTHIVLSISGIFREGAQIMLFTRNFRLKHNDDGYFITNDQLLVQNAKDLQINWGFRLPPVNSHLPYFSGQYKMVELVLHRLTRMNKTFCLRYLYFCQYDLIKALQIFCELHVQDEVPKDAFVHEVWTEEQDENSFHKTAAEAAKALHGTVNAKTVWLALYKDRMEKWPAVANYKSETVKKMYRKTPADDSSSTSKRSAKPGETPAGNSSSTSEQPTKTGTLVVKNIEDMVGSPSKVKKMRWQVETKKNTRFQGLVKANVPPPDTVIIPVAAPLTEAPPKPQERKATSEDVVSLYKFGYVINDKALPAVVRAKAGDSVEVMNDNNSSLDSIKNAYASTAINKKTTKSTPKNQTERKKISIEIKKLPKEIKGQKVIPALQNQQPTSSLADDSSDKKSTTQKSATASTIETINTASIIQKPPVLLSKNATTSKPSQPQTSTATTKPTFNKPKEKNPAVEEFLTKIQTSLQKRAAAAAASAVVPAQTPVMPMLVPDPSQILLQQTMLMQNQAMLYPGQPAVMYQNQAAPFIGSPFVTTPGYYQQYPNIYSNQLPSMPSLDMEHEKDPEQDYLPCPLAPGTEDQGESVGDPSVVELPAPPGEENVTLLDAEGKKTNETGDKGPADMILEDSEEENKNEPSKPQKKELSQPSKDEPAKEPTTKSNDATKSKPDTSKENLSAANQKTAKTTQPIKEVVSQNQKTVLEKKSVNESQVIDLIKDGTTHEKSSMESKSTRVEQSKDTSQQAVEKPTSQKISITFKPSSTVSDPIEVMFFDIILELVKIKYKEWTPNIQQNVMLKELIRQMHFFVKRLETCLETSGKRTVSQQDASIVQTVLKGAIENILQCIGYGILHVIFHEMFQYKKCERDPDAKREPLGKVGTSTSVSICSDRIYSKPCVSLLARIRTELSSKQNTFKCLRFYEEFKRQQGLEEPSESSEKQKIPFSVPNILCGRHTMRNIQNVIVKVFEHSVDYEREQFDLKLLEELSDSVSKHFENLMKNNFKSYKANLEIDDSRFDRYGQKDIIYQAVAIARGLVHIIIHKYIENSSCNNTSDDAAFEESGICSDLIYRPLNKRLLDQMTFALSGEDLKLKFVSPRGHGQDKAKGGQVCSSAQEGRKKAVPAKELQEFFKNMIIDLAKKHEGQYTPSYLDERGSFINSVSKATTSFVIHLDERFGKTVNSVYLNGLLKMIKAEFTAVRGLNAKVNSNIFLRLAKCILHVIFHDMFEHSTCQGREAAKQKESSLYLKNEQKGITEPIQGFCGNTVYQCKDLLSSITKYLEKSEKFFANLELIDEVPSDVVLSKRLSGIQFMIPFIQITTNSSSELVAEMLKMIAYSGQEVPEKSQGALTYFTDKIIKNVRILAKSDSKVTAEPKISDDSNKVASQSKDKGTTDKDKRKKLVGYKIPLKSTKDVKEIEDVSAHPIAQSNVKTKIALTFSSQRKEKLVDLTVSDDEDKLENTTGSDKISNAMKANRRNADRFLGIDQEMLKDADENGLLTRAYKNLLHVMYHELCENSECLNSTNARYFVNVEDLKTALCLNFVYKPQSQSQLQTVRKTLYEGELKIIAIKEMAEEKQKDEKENPVLPQSYTIPKMKSSKGDKSQTDLKSKSEVKSSKQDKEQSTPQTKSEIKSSKQENETPKPKAEKPTTVPAKNVEKPTTVPAKNVEKSSKLSNFENPLYAKSLHGVVPLSFFQNNKDADVDMFFKMIKNAALPFEGRSEKDNYIRIVNEFTKSLAEKVLSYVKQLGTSQAKNKEFSYDKHGLHSQRKSQFEKGYSGTMLVNAAKGMIHVITHELYENSECPKEKPTQGICSDSIYTTTNTSFMRLLKRIRMALYQTYSASEESRKRPSVESIVDDEPKPKKSKTDQEAVAATSKNPSNGQEFREVPKLTIKLQQINLEQTSKKLQAASTKQFTEKTTKEQESNNLEQTSKETPSEPEQSHAAQSSEKTTQELEPIVAEHTSNDKSESTEQINLEQPAKEKPKLKPTNEGQSSEKISQEQKPVVEQTSNDITESKEPSSEMTRKKTEELVKESQKTEEPLKEELIKKQPQKMEETSKEELVKKRPRKTEEPSKEELVRKQPQIMEETSKEELVKKQLKKTEPSKEELVKKQPQKMEETSKEELVKKQLKKTEEPSKDLVKKLPSKIELMKAEAKDDKLLREQDIKKETTDKKLSVKIIRENWELKNIIVIKEEKEETKSSYEDKTNETVLMENIKQEIITSDSDMEDSSENKKVSSGSKSTNDTPKSAKKRKIISETGDKDKKAEIPSASKENEGSTVTKKPKLSGKTIGTETGSKESSGKEEIILKKKKNIDSDTISDKNIIIDLEKEKSVKTKSTTKNESSVTEEIISKEDSDTIDKMKESVEPANKGMISKKKKLEDSDTSGRKKRKVESEDEVVSKTDKIEEETVSDSNQTTTTVSKKKSTDTVQETNLDKTEQNVEFADTENASKEQTEDLDKEQLPTDNRKVASNEKDSEQCKEIKEQSIPSEVEAVQATRDEKLQKSSNSEAKSERPFKRKAVDSNEDENMLNLGDFSLIADESKQKEKSSVSEIKPGYDLSENKDGEIEPDNENVSSKVEVKKVLVIKIKPLNKVDPDEDLGDVEMKSDTLQDEELNQYTVSKEPEKKIEQNVSNNQNDTTDQQAKNKEIIKADEGILEGPEKVSLNDITDEQAKDQETANERMVEEESEKVPLDDTTDQQPEDKEITETGKIMLEESEKVSSNDTADQKEKDKETTKDDERIVESEKNRQSDDKEITAADERMLEEPDKVSLNDITDEQSKDKEITTGDERMMEDASEKIPLNERTNQRSDDRKITESDEIMLEESAKVSSDDTTDQQPMDKEITKTDEGMLDEELEKVPLKTDEMSVDESNQAICTENDGPLRERLEVMETETKESDKTSPKKHDPDSSDSELDFNIRLSDEETTRGQKDSKADSDDDDDFFKISFT